MKLTANIYSLQYSNTNNNFLNKNSNIISHKLFVMTFCGTTPTSRANLIDLTVLELKHHFRMTWLNSVSILS